MSNFLHFIEEDIATKKNELARMSKKGRNNIKKYNCKVDEYIGVYNNYKVQIKKYLQAKSSTINITKEKVDTKELIRQIEELEYAKNFLNPLNSYLEKMGFDVLLFDIGNYSEFNFNSVNEIIESFLDKFELAGIKLSIDDFDYTNCVKEYMTSFIDIRNVLGMNYNTLTPVFEKLYWENPDLIKQIELNFRKLIRKYEKRFNYYITNLQKELKARNNVSNYQECVEKLKLLYSKLLETCKESVADLIELVKKGEIDIKEFFENSRIRESNYKMMSMAELDLDNPQTNEEFHQNLEKLKQNLEEYSNIIKFTPLFNDFKNEFSKEIVNPQNSPKDNNLEKNSTTNRSKIIRNQIEIKEAKLEKINKRQNNNAKFLGRINSSFHNNSKADAIMLAKELYVLYKDYDKERYKEIVLSSINKSSTMYDLIHLYDSYEYFKRETIKRVYNLNTYEEIEKYCHDFEKFVKNPNNVIINGLLLFADNNIPQIIINKYRLDKININEINLEPDNINVTLKNINFLLRIYEMSKSKITPEKIWFINEVEKIVMRDL